MSEKRVDRYYFQCISLEQKKSLRQTKAKTYTLKKIQKRNNKLKFKNLRKEMLEVLFFQNKRECNMIPY